VACGRGSNVTKLRRLNPSGNSYVCSSCEIRFGREKLQAEFDRQLGKAVGVKPTLRSCVRGCGRPVFMKPGGNLPAYCSQCEEEWRQLQRSARSEREYRKRHGKRTQLDIVDESQGK